MNDVKMPEGYEQCAWDEVEYAFVPGKGVVPVKYDEQTGKAELHRLGEDYSGDIDVQALSRWFGVIPVRKVTPKPVVITAVNAPFVKTGESDNHGHITPIGYYALKLTNDYEAKKYVGKSFIELTPEVRAALAKDGIEVGS